MERQNLLNSAITAVLLVLLMGCQSLTIQAPIPTIEGRVDLSLLYPRQIQAEVADVANAATVSLMETVGTTSITVASTVTKVGGGFTLTIPGFKVDTAKTYLMEAFKGLEENKVNKDAVRIRTLLQYRDGWVSITNTFPNLGIVLGQGSTAIAAMYALKYSAMDPATLMGSVQDKVPESLPLPASQDLYTPPNGVGPTKQEFHTVSDLVYRSIVGDTDPLTGLEYDATNQVFVIKTNKDPFIDNLSSTAAGYGSPLVISGYRFETDMAQNTIFFGGATSSYTATIDLTKPNSSNVLYVTVPEGCPSGEVKVRNSTGFSNGIYFKVIPRVGGKVAN